MEATATIMTAKNRDDVGNCSNATDSISMENSMLTVWVKALVMLLKYLSTTEIDRPRKTLTEFDPVTFPTADLNNAIIRIS